MSAGEEPRQGAIAALRGAFANPDLRRVLLALAGSTVGMGAYAVTVLLVAFDAGGAAAVALALVGQQLPSALAAPFVSLAADRFPRARVLVGVDLLRVAGVAALGLLVAADAPLAPIIVVASVMSIAFTTYTPATRALLPSLARSPAELTAANSAVSGIDNAGLLIAPAAGAAVSALLSPEWVFAGSGVLFAWAALLVVRLDSPRPQHDDQPKTLGRQLFAGLRAVATTGALRVLVGLYAAQVLVAGFLNVAAIVLAEEEVGLGDSGVGLLLSAVGAGGIAGGFAAAGMAGRRVTGTLAFGLVLWGVGLALLGAVPLAAITFTAAAAVGFADVWVDVGIVTLLQRVTPDEILGRVFGVLESTLFAMAGLGALLATAAIEALGVRTALVAAGALLPITVALAWRRLRALDAAAEPAFERVALLRRLSIFQPLPAIELERLAAHLEPVEAAAGEVVIREREPGDRFFLIVEGDVDISINGHPIGEQGPGEGFGEIALLRSVPRIATVTARVPVRLLALQRDVFLAAVTSHPASAAAADAVVASRLARGRARLLVP